MDKVEMKSNVIPKLTFDKESVSSYCPSLTDNELNLMGSFYY